MHVIQCVSIMTHVIFTQSYITTMFSQRLMGWRYAIMGGFSVAYSSCHFLISLSDFWIYFSFRWISQFRYFNSLALIMIFFCYKEKSSLIMSIVCIYGLRSEKCIMLKGKCKFLISTILYLKQQEGEALLVNDRMIAAVNKWRSSFLRVFSMPWQKMNSHA